jgi:hypothetical protein
MKYIPPSSFPPSLPAGSAHPLTYRLTRVREQIRHRRRSLDRKDFHPHSADGSSLPQDVRADDWSRVRLEAADCLARG